MDNFKVEDNPLGNLKEPQFPKDDKRGDENVGKPKSSCYGHFPNLCNIQQLCHDAMSLDNFKHNEDLYVWAYDILHFVFHRCDLTDVFLDIRKECDFVLMHELELEKANPNWVSLAHALRREAVLGDEAIRKEIEERKSPKWQLLKLVANMRDPIDPNIAYTAQQVQNYVGEFADMIEKIVGKMERPPEFHKILNESIAFGEIRNEVQNFLEETHKINSADDDNGTKNDRFFKLAASTIGRIDHICQKVAKEQA